MADRVCTAIFENGEITRPQLVQLGFAWKGVTNFLGWAGVAPTLKPDLRGPLAYVLGMRCLRLNKPDDAAALFKTARDDAPKGSRLKALAQAELDRLATRSVVPTPVPSSSPKKSP